VQLRGRGLGPLGFRHGRARLCPGVRWPLQPGSRREAAVSSLAVGDAAGARPPSCSPQSGGPRGGGKAESSPLYFLRTVISRDGGSTCSWRGEGIRGLEQGSDPSHGDVQMLQVLLSRVFVFGHKLIRFLAWIRRNFFYKASFSWSCVKWLVMSG